MSPEIKHPCDAMLKAERNAFDRVAAGGPKKKFSPDAFGSCRCRLRESFMKRGYRWNDGTGGGQKSWYTEVSDDLLGAESDFLR
jgi:hypothetical protein